MCSRLGAVVADTTRFDHQTGWVPHDYRTCGSYFLRHGKSGWWFGTSFIFPYGCESKCKVWIMLRAHMCSRPTIQTPDPDPFRGNDPDVMIQTEMMNNSIDVRTPCGIVQKAISHVQCHTFLYLDVSSTDLKINYKAALHGSR